MTLVESRRSTSRGFRFLRFAFLAECLLSLHLVDLRFDAAGASDRFASCWLRMHRRKTLLALSSSTDRALRSVLTADQELPHMEFVAVSQPSARCQ